MFLLLKSSTLPKLISIWTCNYKTFLEYIKFEIVNMKFWKMWYKRVQNPNQLNGSVRYKLLSRIVAKLKLKMCVKPIEMHDVQLP